MCVLVDVLWMFSTSATSVEAHNKDWMINILSVQQDKTFTPAVDIFRDFFNKMLIRYGCFQHENKGIKVVFCVYSS